MVRRARIWRIWMAASLALIVAAVARTDADFGPAADVKAIRDAIERKALPPGIESGAVTVTDVAVVGNFALGTYQAGPTTSRVISQQGFCRAKGAWTRIFAGVAGTADLIQAGYPPDVAKDLASRLDASREVDAHGRDPNASADDRQAFGPEAIASASQHFKRNGRCDYESTPPSQ
jgi:hypothetical protein